MFWRLIILLNVAAYTDAADVVRCFECTDLPHPSDCGTVTFCSDGQICVVEQFITSGGLVLYNSGCQSKQRCSISRRRDIPQYSSLSKRSDIITCDQCCDGEFCNNEGCGNTEPAPSQRGVLCYGCDYENNPKNCRRIKSCDIGDVCMLRELQARGPNGETVYNSACVSPRVCQTYSLLGKKRNTYCHVCCSDDFCNDRCDALITRAPTTPTLPPTTTPMTTTSTTTPKPTTTTTMTPKPTTTTTMTTPKPTTTTTTTPKPTTTTTPKPTTTTTTTPKPTTTTTTPKPTTTTTTTPKPTTTTTTTPKPTTTTTTTKATTTTRKATTTRHQTLHDVCKLHQYHYDANSHLCYKFHHIHKTWDDANTLCKHEGGTLAIINTQLKWDFLKNALKQDSKYDNEKRIFIGGKYTGHNKVFKWVDGSSVQFAEWAHGEPDGEQNACIYLRRGQDFQWHDTSSCDVHTMFVCSIQI